MNVSYGNEQRLCVAAIAQHAAKPPHKAASQGLRPYGPQWKKGWSIMRQRNTHINLRTTPQEKKNIDCRARKCGLSTSEYLRKLAAGYEPKALPPVDYFVLIEALNNIYRELQTRYTPELEGKILQVILQLQEQFLQPGKEGNISGNDADLAGSGQSETCA